MLNQVIITSPKCLIPNGEVLFKLKNEKTLVVKINVKVEQFNCKFKRIFSCSEIPEFKAFLVKKPHVLFKRIIGNNLFPESLTHFFFNPQEELIKNIEPISKWSNYKMESKWQEDDFNSFGSRSDENIRSSNSFDSLEKISIIEGDSKCDPLSIRQRSKSHSNLIEESRMKSLPEISLATNFSKSTSRRESLPGKNLGITKRTSPRENTHNLSTKSHRNSSREFNQSQFSGFYKQLSPLDCPKSEFLDSKHFSFENTLQPLSLDFPNKSHTSRQKFTQSQFSGFHKQLSPLDVPKSEFLDSSKHVTLLNTLQPSSLDSPKSLDSKKKSRRANMELDNSIVNQSVCFKMPGPGIDCEGQFILKEDKTFDMKVQFIFQECRCEFERSFSSLDNGIIDFNASLIHDPYKLFEKMIEKRLISEKFNPFFYQLRETIETIDEICPVTKRKTKPKNCLVPL